MNAKETYKLKIETEVKLANVKISALKADSKNYQTAALIKYTKHIDEVQHLSDAVASKLAELGKASNDSWEKLKDGVERALRLLDVVIKGTADKFQKKYVKQAQVDKRGEQSDFSRGV